MKKVCALIPAYNEANLLGGVLKKIKQFDLEIIVIDDGSTDNTAALAIAENVTLVRHPFNLGKGRALMSGIKLLADKDCDYVITLDGDGQHNPEEIPLFIEAAEKTQADLIIGNRLHNPRTMPANRVFFNRLSSKIISGVCRQNIPDALCGYRAIKKSLLDSLRLSAPRFDIDPQIVIQAAKSGAIISSINIECIYASEKSHINPLPDAYQFCRIVIKEGLKNPGKR